MAMQLNSQSSGRESFSMHKTFHVESTKPMDARKEHRNRPSPAATDGAQSTEMCMCVPKTRLPSTCPLPHISTFRERLSLRGEGLHHTSGLGPHHPLIRDWHHKKLRRADSTSTSPSLLALRTHAHSDSTIQAHSEHTTTRSRGATDRSDGRADSESRKIKFPTRKQSSKLQEMKGEEVTVCNRMKQSTAMKCASRSRNINIPVKENCDSCKSQHKKTRTCTLPMEPSSSYDSSRRHSSVPSAAQPQFSATLPGITSSQLTTTTGGSTADCGRRQAVQRQQVRKPTVHFTYDDRSKLPTRSSQLLRDSSSLHTSSCETLDSKSVSSSSNITGSHSQTQAYRFGHVTSSGDCLVSTLSCHDTDRGGIGAELTMTSLPSLPHIHSTAVCNEPSRTSSTSISCIHSGSSDRTCLSARQTRRERRQNGRHCSVINLRIPFGKVEEWDVPQSVRSREEEEEEVSTTGGDERVSSSELCEMRAGGGQEDVNTKYTSNIGRLEFIVFSDLPKQPLPSTSTLVASIMQTRPSPHASYHPSHHHTSHTLYWPHPHTDHITANANNDSITHTNTNTPNPDTTDPSSNRLNMCTAFATNSGTNLHAPCVNATSFISQCFPHTLRYRHPTSRRGSLPPRLVDHTVSSDCNHSMCITSYPTHHNTHPTTGSRDGTHTTSCGDGGISTSQPTTCNSDGTLINTSQAGATPSLSSSGDSSAPVTSGRDGTCNSPHSPHCFLSSLGRHSRPAQNSGGVSGGRERECRHHYRRTVNKKHSHNNNSNTFAYPDPLSDCSRRYHHRLLRLAALVTDTLTHEHTKKRQKTSH